MDKEQLNVRVDREAVEMVRELSRQSGKLFDVHMSQNQVVEMAIRSLHKRWFAQVKEEK